MSYVEGSFRSLGYLCANNYNYEDSLSSVMALRRGVLTQTTSLCFSKCVNSQVQNTNDCVVRYHQKLLQTSHKKTLPEMCCDNIGAFRFFVHFFIVVVEASKLSWVLDFSMKLNSVDIIQNCNLASISIVNSK